VSWSADDPLQGFDHEAVVLVVVDGVGVQESAGQVSESGRPFVEAVAWLLGAADADVVRAGVARGEGGHRDAPGADQIEDIGRVCRRGGGQQGAARGGDGEDA
jgi:hypothetical protein